MIIRTQAIPLTIRPWSKTSHIVTWLTEDCGTVVTSVKGACRPKSAFLGQYDLFYTCDLLFYRRDREGVHAIRECAPVCLREPLRHHWRAAAAAAYLTDLTARVTSGHTGTTELFHLLSRTLDTLSDAEKGPVSLFELMVWYEIHLLRPLGLLPDLSPCPQCAPDPEHPWLRFSLPAGRFVCVHRGGARPDEPTLPVHRAVRALFERFCRQANPPSSNQVSLSLASKKNPPPSHLLLGLSRFLGMFITFHLDVPSAVRRVTWEMINTTDTQTPASVGD